MIPERGTHDYFVVANHLSADCSWEGLDCYGDEHNSAKSAKSVSDYRIQLDETWLLIDSNLKHGVER